jgi:hypothetical protein
VDPKAAVHINHNCPCAIILTQNTASGTSLSLIHEHGKYRTPGWTQGAPGCQQVPFQPFLASALETVPMMEGVKWTPKCFPYYSVRQCTDICSTINGYDTTTGWSLEISGLWGTEYFLNDVGSYVYSCLILLLWNVFYSSSGFLVTLRSYTEGLIPPEEKMNWRHRDLVI